MCRGQAKPAIRRTWCLLCISVAVWHAGRFMMEIAPSSITALRAINIIYLGAIFISPFYIHFISSLLEENAKNRTLLVLYYCIAFGEVCLLFGGWLLNGVALYPWDRFYEVPGRMYLLFFFSWSVIPTIAIKRLVDGYIDTTVVVKKKSVQIRFVIERDRVSFWCNFLRPIYQKHNTATRCSSRLLLHPANKLCGCTISAFGH